MDSAISSIPIHDLPFFNNLVKDYLSQKISLKGLYQFSPDMEGIRKSLISKEKNYTQRALFNRILDHNYANLNLNSELEKENIDVLRTSGYAVTTAHQPNLFLGPLYIITKAVSTIALAEKANQELGEKKIVPIFVIGSEDHDHDELLHSYLFGKKHAWTTSQKGSVGTMLIDDSFIQVLEEWTNSFGSHVYASELAEYYRNSYARGKTVATGFASMLRTIFGKYGLVVLDLNMPEVKAAMIPVFEKELKENFALHSIQPSLKFLNENYSIQAEPRDINLFEYNDGERKRIVHTDTNLIEKLYKNPELFSPNVILRPLMQQTVLPSIANIGGGAEVSYWLQLKPIFDAEGIDFPVILLRDIYSPIDAKSMKKWVSLGLSLDDFFISDDELKRKIALKDSSLEHDFKHIEAQTLNKFAEAESIISSLDKSLIGSYQAELTKIQKSFETLYQKALKAEKKKNEEVISATLKVKHKVFEENYLIERRENFSSYYLRYGSAWIEQMLVSANPLKNSWKLHRL